MFLGRRSAFRVLFLLVIANALIYFSYRAFDARTTASLDIGSIFEPGFLDIERSDLISHYSVLLEKYGSDFSTQYTQDEKCMLYFNELHVQDPDWSIKDVEKSQYLEEKKQELRDAKKRQKQENWEEISEDELAAILKAYEAYREVINVQTVDAMTHLRVFNKCFIEEETFTVDFAGMTQALAKKFEGFTAYIFDKMQRATARLRNEVADSSAVAEDGYNAMCSDIESRLVPWFTKQHPVFERWDGTVADGLPDMAAYNKKHGTEIAAKSTATSGSQCYLKNLKESINGRGIVVSVGDVHLQYMIAFIGMLRVLNNKLPIQVVYNDDLSATTKQKFIEAARGSASTNKFISSLNKKYSRLLSVHEINTSYPPQELWFVDVHRSITPKYQDKFPSYSGKYLATFFNSFDEMLLVDADSVPFVEPNDFFNTTAYRTTETIFFKDRLSIFENEKPRVELFRKLMPTLEDEVMFGIHPATGKTFDNRFFAHNKVHLMESGIVGLRRSTHFMGIVAGIQLNFWDVTREVIFGDKESYWLGLSLVGDENYEFNRHGAGAIAEDKTGITYDERDSRYLMKICSVQPAHISGDDNSTLLWINSAFQKCKRDATDQDILLTKFSKKFGKGNTEDLKTYYRTPIHILGVLIPPAAEIINGRNLRKGWAMAHECGGFRYCALDKYRVGDARSRDIGTFVEFDESLQSLYDYYGQVWVHGFDMYFDSKKID